MQPNKQDYGACMNTDLLALETRKTSLKMVHSAGASHIGSALSIADILAVLYGDVMNYSADDPKSEDRDRFILSKGHACVAVYSVLHHVGLISESAIKSYGQDFSPLMNHISHKAPGVEFSTGSLGHGLPFAVGKAKAAKMKRESWHTYVVLGDGEMAEGANWEALMFASHHELDNLTLIVDYNNLQSLTTVDETLRLEPLHSKLTAFGCEVVDLDGHDHQKLKVALSTKPFGGPKAIIARTTKGKGISYMEDSVDWHYKTPNDDQLAAALRELANA